MQDDTSADVQANDDDIEDAPLFAQPVTAEAATEAPTTTTEEAETKGVEGEAAKTTDEANTEAKDTEATATEEAATEQTTETAKAPDPQAAYRAYQERQRTREAVEQQLDQVYGPKTEQQLYEENIDNGLSEEQAQAKAELQALREEFQYATQRTQLAELNATLNTDALNVANEYSVFNEKSPDYDKDFTEMVGQAYQQAARVQADQNGIILNADIPLYDFYKRMADIYNRGSSKGAAQAQTEAVETLSRVEAVSGGSSSTNRHAETLEEMGERLADMPLI